MPETWEWPGCERSEEEEADRSGLGNRSRQEPNQERARVGGSGGMGRLQSEGIRQSMITYPRW